MKSLLRLLLLPLTIAHLRGNDLERVHFLRRLHGADSARSAVEALENSMERYQTGLPTDPSHRVPYRNHPYDHDTRRSLQESNATDRFQPMRIVFDTAALDELATTQALQQKITWFETDILPKVANYWSQALSVVPVDGRLVISAADLQGREFCGDAEFSRVPSEHIATGVSNTDLLLYVSGSNSERFCPARTLAVAVPCNFDQFDRPTAGAINVCLDNIQLESDGTASTAVTQDYFDVTIHEVAHVLGHSSNSYRFFWDDKTGQPRTPRPFETRQVTCVNGDTKTSFFPADNTMVFGETSNGQRYASIVTPKVAQVARNQFNCQTIEGARLENQPTRPDSCNGDHWDERLFYPEALSGVISPTANILSSLTLALMEDSGWYKANYTMSRMSPWGLGAGCAFVDEPCLVAGNVPGYSQGFFCNDQGEKACSSELTHKMACTVSDYYHFVPQNLPPPELQYFPDAPSLGGPRQADYCPVYGSTYGSRTAEELDCKNLANGRATVSLYSEVFGETSKCIPTTTGEGRCFEAACIKETMSLDIYIGGKWRRCDSDGQVISLGVAETGGLPITVLCPKLSQACPDLFCPFNCAGRGICNYDNVVNGTIRPTCECFDETDTSEACSDSDIPTGDYLDNADGLFDNLEENFFDPLIAVFVDSPDKWTSASWAWAGTLIALCVLLICCICSSCCSGSNKR